MEPSDRALVSAPLSLRSSEGFAPGFVVEEERLHAARRRADERSDWFVAKGVVRHDLLRYARAAEPIGESRWRRRSSTSLKES